MAQEIITRFHDAGAAEKALKNFEVRIKRGEIPENIEEKQIIADGDGYAIANLLKDSGLTASTTEARNMIKQGAVKIDGEKISDIKLLISINTKTRFD